jgi:hypothetical protein
MVNMRIQRPKMRIWFTALNDCDPPLTSITAKVLQLGVPVVTAFQVCRLVAVLILVGPIFQWSHRRKKTA